MDNILVVDDEAQIRHLLQKCLESAGYRCRTAEHVAMAKDILAAEPFELIISDINMPGESGIDLIQHVKQTATDTAVVVVSVIDNPEEAKAVLELGVYGYIVKPFTRNLVLITVDNALRRHRLERQEKKYQQKLEEAVKARSTELFDQLAFMQTLINAIPNPIYYKNTQGFYLGCNQAFEVFYGKASEAIIGSQAHGVMDNHLADISYRTDKKILEDGGRQVYEATAISADGTVHEVIVNKAAYGDNNGHVAGVVGVIVDITERKEMESELRTSEEKYRQIVDNIGIGVAMISPQAQVLEMNRQMRSWFPSTEPGEPTPCYHLFNHTPSDQPCEGCPTMDALATGKVCEAVIGAPEKAGQRCFRIIASPIHDRNGGVTAAIELVEDVTDKLALERELRQAQKLEAIGQLAAGIAHEINTPIQYVGDNIRFLQEAFEDISAALKAYGQLQEAVERQSPSDEIIMDVKARVAEADLPYLAEEIPNAIEQSLEGVQRVSKIVRAMREFSHPGTEQKVEVDLNQALENTITVARNEWKYVAEMETDFEASMPAVPCFPGEMNQVFLNLIVNASHAISDVTDGGRLGKGKISISTRADKDAVTIRISDSGSGIPEAIQTRIFDPFFTTKAVGKGTGQGLAIARGVVTDKHGGTLHFNTQSGKGTTFIIVLPLTDSSEKGESADA